MSKNLNTLALRRQSIRTLSPAELRVAQGGRRPVYSGGNGTGGGTGNGTGTGTGNGTGTGGNGRS